MKTILSFLVALLLSVNVYAGEVTFVANHTELYVALEAAERGTIGSVAISEKYMQEGTSRVQKNQIRGLIARVFELGDRAVYIYGSPLDVSFANESLGGDRSCSQVFALGRIPSGRVVCMFADTMSEDKMRNSIRNYDMRNIIRIYDKK